MLHYIFGRLIIKHAPWAVVHTAPDVGNICFALLIYVCAFRHKAADEFIGIFVAHLLHRLGVHIN